MNLIEIWRNPKVPDYIWVIVGWIGKDWKGDEQLMRMMGKMMKTTEDDDDDRQGVSQRETLDEVNRGENLIEFMER